MNARSHELRVPGGVPMLVVRFLLFAFSVAALLLLDAYPLWLWVAVVTAALGAIMPVTLAAWGPIVCIAVTLLTAEPSAGRAAFALFAVALIHLLASLAWVIPWRSRVRPAAIRPSARRFLAIQAIVQPVVLAVGLIPRLTGAGFAWLAPLGAVALVGIAVLLRRAHDFADAR